MTDKTEAQPEALRLANRLDCDATDADMGRKPIACTRRRAAAELRRLHAEIQQLKAQLSARQAAPDWIEELAQSWDECMYDAPGEMIDIGASIRKAARRAAPPPPEREPLSKQQVSKIALDLLMANCTWHALQNTGFFHEIVPFTVEIVAATERAHGIGATNRAEGPIFIDRARMDRALAGPFFTLPEGLTPAEIVAHLRGTGGEG